MTRVEFEALRNLPNKLIADDIEISLKKNATIYQSKAILVANAQNLLLQLNVSYHPHVQHYTFNFSVKGVGPICRYDINGAIHGNAGRTHKHSLQTDRCPDLHLPGARERKDLDNPGQTIEDVWKVVCNEANLLHHGRIVIK